VRLRGHLDLERDPPAPHGSLLLLYPEAQVETAAQARGLLDWVAAGGRLVLPIPRGEAAPMLSAALRERLGVRVLRGEAALADCPRLLLPGRKDSEAVCGTPFQLAPGARPVARWPREGEALRFARLALGEGEVILLADLALVGNGALSRQAEAPLREARTRLLAELMSPLLDGGPVQVLAYRGGSFIALLAREGWPFFLAAACALAAWLALMGQRLGPLQPSPAGRRRSLREHLDAAGRFGYRHDHGLALHAALREAVRERLARRHALAGLDELALAQALADRSGQPEAALRAALDLPPRATPEQYRAAMALLSAVYHRL
jgi:hypothetical protein